MANQGCENLYIITQTGGVIRVREGQRMIIWTVYRSMQAQSRITME